MTKQKLCPLRFSRETKPFLPADIENAYGCLEEKCAWWDEKSSACSIAISQVLTAQMAALDAKTTQDLF